MHNAPNNICVVGVVISLKSPAGEILIKETKEIEKYPSLSCSGHWQYQVECLSSTGLAGKAERFHRKEKKMYQHLGSEGFPERVAVSAISNVLLYLFLVPL